MPLKTGWEKFKQGTRETFGSGDKTQLPADLLEMSHTAEVIKKNYESIVSKTEAYLNSSGGRFDVFSSKDKLSRLPIYVLGTSMKEISIDLSDYEVGTIYDQCSEVFLDLAQHEFEFDLEVQNKFLQPKIDFLKTDIKEALYHYDKLKSRRLDYDAKRHKLKDAKTEKVVKYESELHLAQRKLDESTDLTRQYLTYIADQKERNSAQYAELMAFMQSMMDYHQRCYEALKKVDHLLCFSEHMSYTPAPRPQIVYDKLDPYSSFSEDSTTISTDSGLNRSTPSSPPPPPRYPRLLQCRALYDFTPQQTGDLGIRKGDIVEITREVSQDWWEGMVDGHTGVFPSNYVERI